MRKKINLILNVVEKIACADQIFSTTSQLSNCLSLNQTVTGSNPTRPISLFINNYFTSTDNRFENEISCLDTFFRPTYFILPTDHPPLGFSTLSTVSLAHDWTVDVQLSYGLGGCYTISFY